jgi:hypothetical protein
MDSSQEKTMRQVSLTIKTSPAIKEILKEIAWEELRTLSGQVEIILVKWLEAEGHSPQPPPADENESNLFTLPARDY